MKKMTLVKMAGLSTALLLASLLLSACGSGGGGGHGGDGQPVSPEKPVPEKTDKNKEKANPDTGKVKPAEKPGIKPAPEKEPPQPPAEKPDEVKPVPPAVKPEEKPVVKPEPEEKPEIKPAPEKEPPQPPAEKPDEVKPVPPVVKPEEKPADPADKEKPPVAEEGKEDKDNPQEGNDAEPVVPDVKPAEKPVDKVARYEGRVVEYTSNGNGFLSDGNLSVTKQDPTLTAAGEYFIFTASADGKNVDVMANPVMPPEMKNITLSTKEMTAFINEETNKLVGVYGRAKGAMEGINTLTKEDDKFEVSSMGYFADENSRKQPEVDANYRGKFLYYYEGTPQTADVSFNYQNKEITGSITDHDVNKQWDINGNKEVGDDGRFSVMMISNDQKYAKDGTLDGGFYGQHGEFLLGSAKSVDEGKQWRGVVGAEKAAQPAVAAH